MLSHFKVMQFHRSLLFALIATCPVQGNALYAMSPTKHPVLYDMAQLGTALHSYASSTGAFPQYACTVDGSEYKHSWRVALLPYLDAQELYDQYRFDEPWNSKNNLLLLEQMPDVYSFPDPSSGGYKYLPRHEVGTTNYLAIVGENTLWPYSEGRRLSRVRDGLENTILLLDARGMGIKWTEPVDLSLSDASELLSSCSHAGHLKYGDNYFSTVRINFCLTHVLFADGHVRRMRPYLKPEIARALFTASGRDVADMESATSYLQDQPQDYSKYPLTTTLSYKWGRILTCCLLSLFAATAVWRKLLRSLQATTKIQE